MDLLDTAVEQIANDDYNHISAEVLRSRLEALRRTHIETKLWEASDSFINEVREALTEDGDPEYGE